MDASHQRAADLADAFGRAGKAVVRAFDQRLGDHGVSTPRSKLLAETARLEPVRLADLARAVGIGQATASSLADALVRDGLVARATDANDRRAIQLTVTEAGRAQAQHWVADYTDAAHELFGCFTRSEQLQLTQLLSRLADALD